VKLCTLIGWWLVIGPVFPVWTAHPEQLIKTKQDRKNKNKKIINMLSTGFHHSI
jgi:hypothetical protein